MDRNPYEPPVAVVRDRRPGTGEPRPAQVTRACQIFWGAFILGLIALHPSIGGRWWEPAAEDSTPLVVAVLAAGLVLTPLIALYVMLIVLVGRRHNWARWALLIFFLLGWIAVASELSTSIVETPFSVAIDVVTAVAETYAFYLLFSGPGAQWFKD